MDLTGSKRTGNILVDSKMVADILADNMVVDISADNTVVGILEDNQVVDILADSTATKDNSLNWSHSKTASADDCTATNTTGDRTDSRGRPSN